MYDIEYDIEALWRFLPLGYCLTIVFEIPVLLIGLSRAHSLRNKLIAGFGLTAFTYPVVVLVLPLLFQNNPLTFLIIAETFAPVAECLLFAFLFHGKEVARSDRIRDFITIVIANLFSFGMGEAMRWIGWL